MNINNNLDKTFKVVPLKRKSVNKEAVLMDKLTSENLTDFIKMKRDFDTVYTIQTSYLGKRLLIGDVFYNKKNGEILLFSVDGDSGEVLDFIFYLFENENLFTEFVNNRDNFSDTPYTEVWNYFSHYEKTDVVRLGSFLLDDFSQVQSLYVSAFDFSNYQFNTKLIYNFVDINNVLIPCLNYKHLYMLSEDEVSKILHKYISLQFFMSFIIGNESNDPEGFCFDSGSLFIYQKDNKVKQIEMAYFNNKLEKCFDIKKNKTEFLTELTNLFKAYTESDSAYHKQATRMREISYDNKLYNKYILQYI